MSFFTSNYRRISTPEERIYSVIPDKLYGGPLPSSVEKTKIRNIIKNLIDKGIRCFVNLMEPNETNQDGIPFNSYKEIALELASDAVFYNFPIQDRCTTTKTNMKKILDCIDSNLNNGLKVYVHCWGGIGRTGTTIGCWLRRHGEENPLKKINELRQNTGDTRPSPERGEQSFMVKSWKVGE